MSRYSKMRRFGAALALLAGWATGGAVAEEAPVASALSYGVHAERVRLMMDVTPTPAFAAFLVTNPDRLIIDFSALDWQIDPETEISVPYIGGVRFGLFRQDRPRLVLDLTQPVGIERIFTQPPRGTEPGRLVADLSPISREAFDARAGWPEQARWQGTPPEPPRVGDGEILVAIDPGHGGVDPGATHGKLREKTVVLRFAKALAAELDARPGYRAYLTREKDVFVPLAERVARAHGAGAHLMISIHADSLAEGRANGISAYTLSEKGSDAAARALAARENRADVIAGADLGGESDNLTRLLVELAQRGTQDESAKLAVEVIGALRGKAKLLRTRPIRQAGFRVLKAPDIPSILLEIGFLDSATDRRRLTDPEWRAKIAGLIADGIAGWRAQASPGFVTPR